MKVEYRVISQVSSNKKRVSSNKKRVSSNKKRVSSNKTEVAVLDHTRDDLTE